jgi:hypothetical protein
VNGNVRCGDDASAAHRFDTREVKALAEAWTDGSARVLVERAQLWLPVRR